jgi:hypothetical protein
MESNRREYDNNDTQASWRFSSYPLKAEYVDLVGKGKGYHSSHVYCQEKDGPNRVKKTFSMILERVFEMV